MTTELGLTAPALSRDSCQVQCWPHQEDADPAELSRNSIRKRGCYHPRLPAHKPGPHVVTSSDIRSYHSRRLRARFLKSLTEAGEANMILETRGTFKREFAGMTYFPLLPQIIIRLKAPRPPVLGPACLEFPREAGLILRGAVQAGNPFQTIPWRRAWQPTPVCLPGESPGRLSVCGVATPQGPL